MSEELKPCPFCGGPAAVLPWHGDGESPSLIRCADQRLAEHGGCSPAPCVFAQSLAEAISRWNRRAASPAMYEALQEAQQAMKPFAEASAYLHPSQPDDGTTLDGLTVSEWRAIGRAAANVAAALASADGEAR